MLVRLGGIWVNPDLIMMVEADDHGEGSIIDFAGDVMLHVDQTPDEVADIINDETDESWRLN